MDDLVVKSSPQHEVTSVMTSEDTSHVYLPINIAKSSTAVKVTDQDGQGQDEVQTEYANNVYVPISIERSTEVKVDLDQLGEGKNSISAKCNALY